MAIPFLRFFTKGKSESPKAVAAPPPPPIEKPSGERLRKTVMPSSARAAKPQEEAAAPTSAPAPKVAVAPATGRVAPRKVAFNAAPPATADKPAATGTPGQPARQRMISLAVADVLPHMPAGYAKAAESIDPKERVLLNAAELEKGMANGRPTVPLATIYEQAPQIFEKPLPDGAATEVPLPFATVLEEVTKLHVRADQQRQTAVPQVETPILQVTLQDSERFGTKIEHIETEELPPVKVEPPTAEAFAAAEPEPVADKPQAAATPTKIPFKLAPAAAADTSAAAAPEAVPGPKRIAFKVSPNGTDEPATESVPASGGPSVPNLSPDAPKRIPFKVTAPCDDLREKPAAWLTAESLGLPPRSKTEHVAAASDAQKAAEAEQPTTAAGATIKLSLKAVFEALPAFQLSDDAAATIPADARLELPFAIVQPQLASGRVMIAPEVFAAGIPEKFREAFKGDCAAAVSLPLQEVLKNLPAASLRMRDDQVEQEVGVQIKTPFSTTAEEDAQRMKVANTPIAKPAEEDEAVAAGEPTPEALPLPDRIRTPLQAALDTDDKLDAKEVVARINRMPGVKASALIFRDGLSLAGNLPEELKADGLCAIVPALMQRIESHTADTKLGALRGFTVQCTQGALTFFAHENLCLATLHANGEIAPEVRERLARVVHEMSRAYSETV